MHLNIINRVKSLHFCAYLLFGAMLTFAPFSLSSYGNSLLTEILIYGIFALSLNLLLGYTGLPSFGHAAFFGIGAYTVGLFSTKIIPGSGFDNFLLVLGLAIIFSFLTGMIFGILVVRSFGATFLMLTLALAQVLWAIAFSWRSFTGGDDGIAGIVGPELWSKSPLSKATEFYYLVCLFFFLSYFFLRSVIRSPFGNALIGIRENELRMRALGYNTWIYKYVAYVIAGVFGGLAGSLHAFFYHYVSPHDLSVELSGTAMFMAIIGSRNIFFGPVIGAAVVLLLKHLVGSVTEYWPFFLGMVFVASVMYARKGISLYLINYIMRLRVWLNGSLKA